MQLEKWGYPLWVTHEKMIGISKGPRSGVPTKRKGLKQDSLIQNIKTFVLKKSFQRLIRPWIMICTPPLFPNERKSMIPNSFELVKSKAEVNPA